MRAITPSATCEFHKTVSEYVRAGKTVISLGLGEAEVGTPQAIVEAAIKALRDGRTKYSAAKGLPELRERVAQKLARDNRIPATPDNILITPGAKNALFVACLGLLSPGDHVLNISPCYVSNIPILELASQGISITNMYLKPDQYRLNKEDLLDKITDKTKLLLVNYPNNPTGVTLSETELDVLVEVVATHGLYLVSDEVYDACILDDTPQRSPASVEAIRDRVITVNGFSKSHFMTGWRIGYLHAPKHLMSTLTNVHQHINTNTAEFIQMAAIEALSGPQTHILEYKEKLRQRRTLYNHLLTTAPFLSSSPYQGGYFAFLNLTNLDMSGDSFSTELLKAQQVAVVPGIVFGKAYDSFCRISFVNKTEIFEEGLTRLISFAQRKYDSLTNN